MFFKRPVGFVKITGGDYIKFPDECFVCGGKAERDFVRYRIYDFKSPNFPAISMFSYKKLTIAAPACKKHYWQLSFLRILFLGFPVVWAFLELVMIGFGLKQTTTLYIVILVFAMISYQQEFHPNVF